MMHECEYTSKYFRKIFSKVLRSKTKTRPTQGWCPDNLPSHRDTSRSASPSKISYIQLGRLPQFWSPSPIDQLRRGGSNGLGPKCTTNSSTLEFVMDSRSTVGMVPCHYSLFKSQLLKRNGDSKRYKQKASHIKVRATKGDSQPMVIARPNPSWGPWDVPTINAPPTQFLKTTCCSNFMHLSCRYNVL